MYIPALRRRFEEECPREIGRSATRARSGHTCEGRRLYLCRPPLSHKANFTASYGQQGEGANWILEQSSVHVRVEEAAGSEASPRTEGVLLLKVPMTALATPASHPGPHPSCTLLPIWRWEKRAGGQQGGGGQHHQARASWSKTSGGTLGSIVSKSK